VGEWISSNVGATIFSVLLLVFYRHAFYFSQQRRTVLTYKVAIGQFTKSQLENAKHSVDSDCTAGRKTWTRTSANCRIQPYFKAEFIAVRKRFHNQPTTALSGDSPWLFIL
jgi:hypothetical protein